MCIVLERISLMFQKLLQNIVISLLTLRLVKLIKLQIQSSVNFTNIICVNKSFYNFGINETKGTYTRVTIFNKEQLTLNNALGLGGFSQIFHRNLYILILFS